MIDKTMMYYKKWQDNHSHLNGIIFFLSGFLFDLITIGRVDDYLNLLTQSLFLAITAVFIIYKYSDNMIIPSGKAEKLINRFGDEIYHFSLGSLLSAFTIFYFKSSSLANSLLFMIFMIFVLLINELEFIQKMGLLTKAILFQFCLFSFFSIIIPVLIGTTGFWIFLLSIALGLALTFGMVKLLIKLKTNKQLVYNQVLKPSVFLATFFLLFYLMRIIPPVPLSTKYIGVFHKLEKKDGQYILKHENPWWKFWNNGDQDFIAKPNDKIIIFTKIFSPKGFKDKILFHFKFKTKDSGYKTSDKIPMTIYGGRELGFRGFAYKKNYRPGDWKVFVETSDGLELGRISFTVTLDKTRRTQEFKTEIQ